MSIFILGYLKAAYGHIDIHTNATDFLQIPAGILRGTAEMGIGLFCAERTENQNYNSWKLTSISFLVLLSMFVCMVKYPHTTLDFIFIILTAIFITLQFQNNDMMKNRLKINLKWVGILSANIYFCHLFIIRIWQYIKIPLEPVLGSSEYKSMFLFVLFTCICSVLLELCVKKIMNQMENKNAKIIKSSN